jgi:ABC-2 type transport system ATP-binding protein
MIEAQNLTRRYGDFTAVEQISLTVDEGEIVGMLGPNGAGKTTTIRMITGFLPPTEGRVTVGGKDLFADPVGVRGEIGYLPENVALYPEMRVSEYLTYRAMLEGMTRAQAKKRLPETITSCFLEEVEGQIIGTLSKGYRQRVGLAAAILHEPQALVLDEPTVGLDPKQIIAIRELIRELGRERTLLLSTHILPEVELLCDRVIIIDRGRIVAEGTPESLKQSWIGATMLRVELKEGPEGAAEVLERIRGVSSVSPVDDGRSRFNLECEHQSDPREAVFRAAVENGWTLLELAEERASLEDIFVRLTTREVTTSTAVSSESTAPEAAESTDEEVTS